MLQKLCAAVMATGMAVYLTGIAVMLYAEPLYWTQPYHTSALSSYDYTRELIIGHPDCIHSVLGMTLHVFTAFVAHHRKVTFIINNTL